MVSLDGISVFLPKIENAFAKELPNKKDENNELKNIVEKYIKVEYSSFVDDRYYQIKTTVEYNNLLGLLRGGNIKKIGKIYVS